MQVLACTDRCAWAVPPNDHPKVGGRLAAPRLGSKGHDGPQWIFRVRQATMNCRHGERPPSVARRSDTSIPRCIASSSQAAHFPGMWVAAAIRRATTGLPSTLPARQATMNCRYVDGPVSDPRRSVIVMPRFIASASHVVYVDVHDPAFVAAAAGNAMQTMTALVIASVVTRMIVSFTLLQGLSSPI
jgi:hypothetical protein